MVDALVIHCLFVGSHEQGRRAGACYQPAVLVLPAEPLTVKGGGADGVGVPDDVAVLEAVTVLQVGEVSLDLFEAAVTLLVTDPVSLFRDAW